MIARLPLAACALVVCCAAAICFSNLPAHATHGHANLFACQCVRRQPLAQNLDAAGRREIAHKTFLVVGEVRECPRHFCLQLGVVFQIR